MANDFKKVSDLVGGVYAVKWNAKSAPVIAAAKKTWLDANDLSVYSLCAPEPLMFIVVNKKHNRVGEVYKVYDIKLKEKEFIDFVAPTNQDINIARSAKKFILDNKFKIDSELAYKAFGLFKEGDGFLDRFNAPVGYKRKVDHISLGGVGKLPPRPLEKGDRFYDYLPIHKKWLKKRNSAFLFPYSLFSDIEPIGTVELYYYKLRGEFDFSKVKRLDLAHCDLSGAKIKMNPIAESIEIGGAILNTEDKYDFFKVANLDVSRIVVSTEDNVDITFNPHANRIDAVETKGLFRGDLNFSGVKNLNLENSDLSMVTSIKFNPNAESINVIKVKFNPNCKMYGLDDCKNPKLKHVCSVYDSFKTKREQQESQESWLTPVKLTQYCDYTMDRIARWLKLKKHEPILANYIKEVKTYGPNLTFCLQNTPEAIKLFQEKINDNWLTPSMLRKYCTDRHDTIEKYLARMQSDERMKGMIKPVYSNKAKRDVLYLHDDEKSIALFQQILKELKMADLKHGTKVVDTMSKTKKGKSAKSSNRSK